ncbi:NADH dehydrogenase subunit E [Rubritalea squalenifaciens DSM 18772]|uniref:NADH dehydrogenase subunit E n=1 Tax=Rubritalea squalenifaciens DSM 18772 TaxID=1123071 RepID=A0A1M6J3X3_9BACT|nr:NAD(P)H-dependent oxidoreductase subunit E [Rubritalea squalenifaciens]SHJ41357.1 NADH dehydrogenase subunit E [Rubritalea squalenifaciens DSM 18772]
MSQDITLEQAVAHVPSPGDQHFKPFEASAEIEALADERISHYPVSKLSAVLPLLHIVQHHFGYISKEAISWVANKLEIEPIKVLSVVTFYPGFRQVAPGKFHYRVCRTLSCAMAGSYELMDKICEITGIDRSTLSHDNPIAVSPCGNYSVEFAECLASCGSAPVCLVNDDFHENISPDDAKSFVEKTSAQS